MMEVRETVILTPAIASMLGMSDDYYDCLFQNRNTSDITESPDKSDTRLGGQ
jgi:hypothetical protein